MKLVMALAGALALTACESVDGGASQSASASAAAPTIEALAPWTGAAPGVRPAANGAAYVVLREAPGSAAAREPGWLELTYKVINAQTGAGMGEGTMLNWVAATSTDMIDILGMVEDFASIRGQTRVGGEYVYYLPATATRESSQLFRAAHRELGRGPERVETMTPWNSDFPGIQKPDGPGGIEYYVKASGDPAGATPVDRSAEIDTVMIGVSWVSEALPTGGPNVFMKSTPIKTAPRNLIPGVEKAVMRMRPGDVWYVYVPNSLGYANAPPPGSSIHPKADLVFEIAMK